ncbi:type I-A CRISPR-associated protein Csa5 [Sulfurisphaera ohwakuensis]|uniref:CRISPR type I-A-associated protein Csa5 n=1 Tax=Sulfurisphaera ohwakuensis TaxID=69656 RepID=A0A650CK38_SULOH|nr:type I-A CRISPR-associated protein Csa5 [Sulfurisphaera ohwakuensis]MBB5254783.1 CRISPR type I-A-associated protein Csa5 [Sulfurisphaera ohwakuensis]QGR18244.1 type I-A CRISPR-associated protein Csa5 [Sulfurisphaera ohwakuensis]
MSVEKTDTEGIIRRVANLLASVFIYSESPTYVDRFANALSKEAVARVIYESQRIIQMGISSGEVKMGNVEISGKNIKITDKKEGEESYPAVIIKTKEGRNYIVIGYLPTDKDVEDFMSLVERDIYYARKAGALAMSVANRSLLGGGE